MRTASKVAPIYKRSTKLKNWTKYTGVLSGGYLYLFAKAKDPQPESFIWVKNSEFEMQDESIVGMSNAFTITNKYSEGLFATEKQEQQQQWIDAVDKTRTIPKKKRVDERSPKGKKLVK